MKEYRSAPQKSSDSASRSLSFEYGLHISVSTGLIAKGQAAHQRIYEVALRLGVEHVHFSAGELIAWLAENGIDISMATIQRALVDERFFHFEKVQPTGKRG